MFYYVLFQDALGGHMLGIADEDGWVQILDTRKRGQKSIVKGIVNKTNSRKLYLIFIKYTLWYYSVS